MKDIKEQLNPLIDSVKYHSKFRRSGVSTNPQVAYETKAYHHQAEGGGPPFNRRRSTQGQDILTEGGLRALSKLEQTPIINPSKVADLSKSTLEVTVTDTATMGVKPLALAKDQHATFQQEIDNFKTVSKCSNYDTVAMPISEQRKNPFKHKPGSLQCSANTSSVLEANSNDCNTRSVKKSNVFLRAARSITKTKSVSGSFIVKTMICKSNVKRGEEKQTNDENVDKTFGASVPMMVAQKDGFESN